MLLLLALTSAAPAQEDRLGAPGPIGFDGVEHRLSWTGEPQPGYRKQEYLPAGQSPERFTTMVIVEHLEGVSAPEDLARAQVEMLEGRRASDPLVNYEILVNEADSEIILDFLVGGETAEGEAIAEWNGYRYSVGETPDGSAGGWLVAVSRRAYGAEITPFLESLGGSRGEAISELAALSLP